MAGAQDLAARAGRQRSVHRVSDEGALQLVIDLAAVVLRQEVMHHGPAVLPYCDVHLQAPFLSTRQRSLMAELNVPVLVLAGHAKSRLLGEWKGRAPSLTQAH